MEPDGYALLLGSEPGQDRVEGCLGLGGIAVHYCLFPERANVVQALHARTPLVYPPGRF